MQPVAFSNAMQKVNAVANRSSCTKRVNKGIEQIRHSYTHILDTTAKFQQLVQQGSTAQKDLTTTTEMRIMLKSTVTTKLYQAKHRKDVHEQHE